MMDIDMRPMRGHYDQWEDMMDIDMMDITMMDIDLMDI